MRLDKLALNISVTAVTRSDGTRATRCSHQICDCGSQGRLRSAPSAVKLCEYCTIGCAVSGAQMSTGVSSHTPPKSRGAMPTIVKLAPLIASTLPTTPGDPPNRRCQYAWLTTATGS